MIKLCILGNGIDLAHGLPTSYEPNLVEILQKNNKELFEQVTEAFFNDNIDLWKDFEHYIGNTCDDEKLIEAICDRAYEPIQSEFSPFEGVNPLERSTDLTISDNLYEFQSQALDGSDIENIVDNRYKEIKRFLSEGMGEMIRSADKCLTKVSRIPKLSNLLISNKNYYITFNYTHTLEKLYAISRDHICHVHGEYNNKTNNLIYGNENPIPSLNTTLNLGEIELPIDEEEAREIPQSLDDFNISYDDKELSAKFDECIEDITQKYFKKNLQIDRLEKFLSNQVPLINEIVIYGHSLGEVDIPYFELIDKKFPQAKWNVFFHKDEEKISFLKQLNFIDKDRLTLEKS